MPGLTRVATAGRWGVDAASRIGASGWNPNHSARWTERLPVPRQPFGKRQRLVPPGLDPDRHRPRPHRGTRDPQLHSLHPETPDSSVLGRCPSPQPNPPAMPVPTRVTTSLTVGDGDAKIQPEPSNVQPRASASTAWASLFHDWGSFSGPLQWSIVFGSYSAATPAHINADGTTTPEFQRVPTWLVRGVGEKTPYGPCGQTVLAPFNATTGAGMGLETIC